MKNLRSRIGLVAEGNTAGSAVLRLERLPDDLGPVKSVTLSAARRLANLLRGGYAINRFSDLLGTPVVLLRVPDSSLPGLVSELAAAQLDFSEMSFVLCESWLGLQSLQPLQQLGSQVGTLLTLPLIRRDWFVFEGHPKPLRVLRRLIEKSGKKATELAPGGTPALFAAELLAGAVPLASFEAALTVLRASGFSGNILLAAMEQMMQKTGQDLLKGAKGRWGGPLRECADSVSKSHLLAVADRFPKTGEFIDAQVASIDRLRPDRK